MKTKDIPEEPILRFLSLQSGWTDRWKMKEVAFPEWANDKLVLSKMSALIRKQLVDGCPCGCRGDFEITFSGRNLVKMWDLGLISGNNLNRGMIRRDIILCGQ